jgi:LmbE family N-acetylglucosaminyl deacetylase
MPKKNYLLLMALLMGASAVAQKVNYSSAEVYQKLRKLNVLGSVLYVAAHPDDENTSLIAYYANEELYRTAYLSATRGDGGQNLIGPEIREQLGIIRTQELLAARRTDGGEQFFTRANDFGYSKHSDETFNIWDKQQVLADFVWTIRKFRPDVIFTRFNVAPGETHGHHTASAILAHEAFKLAGDKNAFPEQLKQVEVWAPKRLYWNTSPWFYRQRGIEMDTTGLGKIDIGKYNPVLGMSYSEISALSRSMHKSQGFGSTGSRGENWEYLSQTDGPPSRQPMEGVETSWKRVKGGEKVQPFIDEAIRVYDPLNTEAAFKAVLKAKGALADHVDDGFWKQIKLREVDDVLIALSGLYLEVRANDFAFVPGDSITLTLEAVNRSTIPLQLSSVGLTKVGVNEALNIDLKNNERITKTWKVKLPDDLAYSHPYWLQNEGTLGMYKVMDQYQIGLPENRPVLEAEFSIYSSFGNFISKSYAGILQSRPVVFKRNDPVDGEVYRPLEIQPAVMANVEATAVIFANGSPKPVAVRVIAGQKNVSGDLQLRLPNGWSAAPAKQAFSLTNKGDEQVFTFMVTAPATASEGLLEPVAIVDGKTFDRGRTVIEYDHIPTQTLYPTSTTRIVKLDLKKVGSEVGYIAGAGDDIPASLEQIGYKVTLLSKDDVTLENLGRFQAVILGVRAFNTVDWLSFKNQELFEYVKNGGNLIVQYNTNGGLVTSDIAPYPLKISRERVAVEEAEVRILDASHPALNMPNKITLKDFDGWVQERGLYFANQWGREFTALLSANDPGEEPRDGGLLIAPHGKGFYIYTGYSWFRELPAGVSGAYRIFTNLISLENDRIDN